MTSLLRDDYVWPRSRNCTLIYSILPIYLLHNFLLSDSTVSPAAVNLAHRESPLRSGWPLKCGTFIPMLNSQMLIAEWCRRFMAGIDQVPIGHFSRVSGTIFRGGQPSDVGLNFISGLGIKSIVDLRKTSQETLHESMSAKEYNLSYFNIPLGFLSMPDNVIAAVIAVSLHPVYQPIYIHCDEQQTRTSAVIAVCRVAVEGWSFDWAYTEMRDRGFPQWQLFLKKGAQKFADRMTPLNFQQRLWALQELVESNIFTA